MSYISKRTLVSMITGTVLVIGYIIYALGDSSPAHEALKDWAAAILIFIGISVGAQIVILIIFHIAYAIGLSVKETGRDGERDSKNIERIIASETKEDERDKFISLKSLRAGYIVSGIGAVAMLFSIAFGGSVLLSLHIFFGGCALGSLIEGAARIYYNERGV